MNVKELKEFLKDIDDDVEVVVFDFSETLKIHEITKIQLNNEFNNLVVVI